MDNKGFGMNLHYKFEAPMPEMSEPTVQSCHIIVAGMFSPGTETTSDDIVKAGQEIVDQLTGAGIKARFEFEYDGRPVTRENLARYFRVKFENSLSGLSINHTQITVSACTEYVPGSDDGIYVTL